MKARTEAACMESAVVDLHRALGLAADKGSLMGAIDTALVYLRTDKPDLARVTLEAVRERIAA